MELRHIRYFLAVAEERNFTRAAARVGIGQPPLSQQIKDLESEVGTNLFQRLPQGAELTEAGRAFLEIVKGFPAQAERAVRAAQRAARGESGTLRVGFTGSAVFNPVVAGAVRKFRRVPHVTDPPRAAGAGLRTFAKLAQPHGDGAARHRATSFRVPRPAGRSR